MHSHEFEKYIGIPVFGGTSWAWVPAVHVDRAPVDAPAMERCACGEQGYKVPA